MSEISKQIMATLAHDNLFSDEPLVSGLSLTTINFNLVVPFYSLDEDEATRIFQNLDNRASPEKSPCLIDGHDDDDDDIHAEHGDGSNEWGGGDVTAEYDGSKDDSHGLVRCSSAASITSNYIHSMGESSGSASGQNMDHMGVEEVWSNEKHNAYLDLMEANFVRDMYARDYCSLELCANQPLHSQSESESSMVYTGTSSDIMDEMEEESESESESSVVYSSTIMDKMMSSEDAPQRLKTSTSSSSCCCCLCIRRKGGINYINNAKKEKGSAHSHASTRTTESTSTRKRKRTAFPSFANLGPSIRQNIVQQCLPEIDIAKLHEHATTLTNLVQDSSPTIDSNVKKRACPVESHEEESSMKILKLHGKKHLFLSGSYDQVVPNPCINSTGSRQDMQGLAKITRAKGIDLGSTTKPPLQFNSRIERT